MQSKEGIRNNVMW